MTLPCTHEYHEMLKLHLDRWMTETEIKTLTVYDDGVNLLEIRNCVRCRSTLARVLSMSLSAEGEIRDEG